MAGSTPKNGRVADPGLSRLLPVEDYPLRRPDGVTDTFAGLPDQLLQIVPPGHFHDPPGQCRACCADLVQKDRLVALALFDVGKALLPLRGEFHILQLVDGDTDEHPPGGSTA